MPIRASQKTTAGPRGGFREAHEERNGDASGTLTGGSAGGALAPGAAEGSAPAAHAVAGVGDPGFVLRLNNTIQLLSNAAWYVAIPFFPLYLVSQGATPGVVGT